MPQQRQVEIFSAGCSVCDEAVATIEAMSCPSCNVTTLDMNDPTVAARARDLGVRYVPAVVIDGRLADCCTGRGPDDAALRAAGLGQPLF